MDSLGHSAQHAVVSDESDELVLVNDLDMEIGYDTKASCHAGRGILHRAFSIFIVNQRDQLLIQKRSAGKRLWPLFWSNSCCSHPRAGETMEIATRRRTYEELGMRCELQYLYKFKYRAEFTGIGTEHEFCWVYIGRSTDPVSANRNEVDAWRFIGFAQLDRAMAGHPEYFTPWFKMEWRHIRQAYNRALERLW